MKQKDLPVYIDPDDFETLESNAKFPCSSQLMTYRALMSRYYMTIEGFDHYGISAESINSDSPDKVTEFAESVTDDLYGVMARLAPYNYQYNCYLIAKSLSGQFPSRYMARKQFEKALVHQARYKQKNIDVREINGIDIESNNNIYFKQLRKEFRHISPQALDIMHSLGLFFNGDIPGKNLIDYSKEM